MSRLAWTLIVATATAGVTLWYSDNIKQTLVERFSRKPAIVQEYNPEQSYAPNIENRVEPQIEQGLTARIMEGISDAKAYIGNKITGREYSEQNSN